MSTLEVILGLNALDPDTWTKHRVRNIHKFLRGKFGKRLPETARVYHEKVDEQHDVTPRDPAGIERLGTLRGKLLVVVYPAGTMAASIAVNAALFGASLLISKLFPGDKKDPSRPAASGSASNQFSDRQNKTRLLGRIPDSYGSCRLTPDLVAKPRIAYDDQHRETEICQMCLGRGQYEVNSFNILEGDSRAENIEGLSVELYHPGELPGLGTPYVTVGAAIGESARNIYQLSSANGQLLFALNDRTIHGTIPYKVLTNPKDVQIFAHMAVRSGGAGIGIISVPFVSNPFDPTLWTADASTITDKIHVGDVLELRVDPEGNTIRGGGAVQGITGGSDFRPLDRTPFVGTSPNLSDDNQGYTVTAISAPFTFGTFPLNFVYVDVTVSIPAAKQAEWLAINTYVGAGGYYIARALLTPRYKANLNFANEEGAFFIDDPTMESVSVNFVAERGLFADDGKNYQRVDVVIAVYIAPANVSGIATGPYEEFLVTVVGSLDDRTTRAKTAVLTPSFTGRCLISCIRVTQSMWRVEDPSWGGEGKGAYRFAIGGPGSGVIADANPYGGVYVGSFWNPAGPYTPYKAGVEDQVRWTHCYSLSTPLVSAFGDTTFVMTKTVASKAANVRNDRKLSMFATRQIPTWNGTTFTGPLTSSEFAEDIFMAICKDQALGNMPDAQIDFAGIAAAFQQARAYFGDNIVRFSHTFDSESTTLEDMLQQVAESCFCVAYRVGDVIKVKPDIAALGTRIFSHRAMVPGSQQREVNFGTDANYDGVKVDYFDDLSNTIKTLTVPSSSARKPREITIAGLREVTRAAVHAWRAYNRILYQNTTVEIEVTQEAGSRIVNDKVLIADTTSATSQDGEITAVSGLLLTTSQPVVAGVASMYVFLQYGDGTIESILTAVFGPRQLLLATAPSKPVIVDEANARPTQYMLVDSDSARVNGFLIQSKSQRSRLTWELNAINYSHGYYFQDGLTLWVNPKAHADARDESPYVRINTAGGSIVSDATRGLVYSDTGTHEIAVDPGPGGVSITGYSSYTKAAWVNVTLGVAQFIFSFPFPSDENFFISATGALRVTHQTNLYINILGFPPNTWVHVAAVYDAVAGTIRCFMSGEVAATATGVVGGGSRANLKVASALNGKIDDARLYFRALMDEEIRELFQKTRL